MKELNRRENLVNIGFYGGLALKAIYAAVEFANGILLMVLNHAQLNTLIKLIALPELREDPQDIAMNYFIKLGKNLSINSQHSAALYLLLHGSTKLMVIWLLLRKRLWAYPLAVIVFGLFVLYEMYSYIHSSSVLLLLSVIMDILIIVLIVMEYKRLKIKEHIKR